LRFSRRIRSRGRERILFDEDVALMMADLAVSTAQGYDSRRDALAVCIGKLQLRQREMLTAHYVEGRQQAEVASMLGLELGAVKVALLRLRRSLALCVRRQLSNDTIS
jgi:RNA polymerase sigma-70 factor (ECF subfamily)